eukprot:CAMPEP_0194215032 /NCGR_PEP_ID=MMETSP0156-20130528/16525_1 /TAXON_ID=33649 /ORGANISM="Thalassionema nitzschioides, Strain L26-B" /LENGTH=321 /DNA_ID=CAMNT_0038943443 /DNA_START=94 /DNA_END=1056 /DNA_ORIENTATION=+
MRLGKQAAFLFLLKLLLAENVAALIVPLQTPHIPYSVSTPRLQNKTPTRFFSNFSAPSSRKPLQAANNLHEDGERMLKKIRSGSKNIGNVKKNLIIACVVLVVGVTQILAGKQQDPRAILFSPNYSTISSTTLLKNCLPSRKITARDLLALSFLGFQIMHVGTFASALSTFFSRCSTWYIECLASFPLYTKALTSALIGLLGDSAAQYFEERRRAKRELSQVSFRNYYDRRRGLSVVADGIFFTGPLLHFAYQFMENLIPTSGSLLPPSVAAMTQVLIDDTFVDAFFVAVTFVTTGVAEGYGMKIFSQLKNGFIPAVKAGW